MGGIRPVGVFVLGVALLCSEIGVWCTSLEGLGTVPKGAAEAALSAIRLGKLDDVRLEGVRQSSVQMYCGHEVQLGLNLDERQYDLSTGAEVDWKKLKGPMLMGQVNGGQKGSNCVLPDISLVGPIELELAKPTRASFQSSPEPMSVPALSKLILREGASARLGGVKILQLRGPVTLPQLPIGYVNSVLGKPSRGKSSSQRTVNGLLHLGTDLHRMALDRPKDSPLLVFDLEASEQGLLVKATGRGDVGVVEKDPGVVEIVETQGGSTSSVDELWAWPFINLKGPTLQHYETLFKSFLSAHWPPLKSPIQVTSASTEALALLRFEMDVRRASLAQDSLLPDFESGEGPLEVWEANVVVRQRQNGAGNDFVPVQMSIAELHDNTLTFSTVSRAMLDENATVTVEDQLSDVYS